MTERFFNFVGFINEKIGAFGLFLICASVITLLFLVVFILSLSVREYAFYKRRWFVLSSTAVCVAQYAVTINVSDRIFVLLSIAVMLLFCSVIFSVRVRQKVDKSHKELINYIDEQIKRANSAKTVAPVSAETPFYCTEDRFLNNFEGLDSKAKAHLTEINTEVRKKESIPDLDFSHVKSVISKLNYYNLSPNDRKQVKELENAIIMAENNQTYPDLKMRINDGLGMLLKIMSKYGV